MCIMHASWFPTDMPDWGPDVSTWSHATEVCLLAVLYSIDRPHKMIL